jgi:anaerobic selenocysteine-containing dehydrogenase/TorA maturation chaperone TorD
MGQQSLSELSANRGTTYAFLSRIFCEEVSADLLRNILESKAFMTKLRTFQSALIQAFPGEEAEAFEEFLLHLNKNDLRKIYNNLKIEYASVFLGMGKAPVYPYESLHVCESGMIMGGAYEEVKEMYAGAGVNRKRNAVEPDDHIAIELEFMSYLCHRVVEAIKKNEEEKALHFLLLQSRFLNIHLSKWVPKFCERLMSTAESGFYRGIATLTKQFVLLDTKTINALLEGDCTDLQRMHAESLPALDLEEIGFESYSPRLLTTGDARVGGDERAVRSTCGMCHGGCGILVHVKEGKIVKVEGDPNSPLSKGTLCAKGLAAKQLVYHPDRLKYPMKRAGKKGEGKWVRVSWSEATQTIAAKLNEIKDKFGVESVGFACGTARPVVFKYVFRAGYSFGTPNTRIGTPHICFSPRLACGTITFGRPIQYHVEENPGCIMAVGGNFFHSNADQNLAKRVLEGMRKGTRLIVVDPSFSSMASKADLWLQIRPATDCALFLGMLNVIISEDLYDRDFVEVWTTGFENLREHVKAYPPEEVEKITWVPAEKIREAARIYAKSKPACLVLGVSVEQNINTTNTVRAAWLLPAITGNVDVPGGNIFWEGPLPQDFFNRFTRMDSIPQNVREKGLGWFPLLYYPSANPMAWRATATGKPYPIRALLVHGSNPLVGHENTKVVYKALKSLDFLVVMDHFMTPTAELADVVLPAATYLEVDDVDWTFSGLTNGTIFPIQKAIEPLWECKDDKQFFIELARAAAFDFGFDTTEETLNHVLSPLGMTFQEFKEKGPITQPQRFRKYELGLLRQNGEKGFDTPSGKIELYSSRLEEMDLDPLPVYKEPKESPVNTPETAQEYPLILITGRRTPVFFHSQYRQMPWLREIVPDPLLEIHPETAKKLGIEEGDWVSVESPRGECKMKARLNAGIHPRVVHAPHSWWFPEKHGSEPTLHGVWESNINILTDNEPPYDPGFGSTPTRGLLCRVRPLS